MAIVKIRQKHKEYEIGYSCVIENWKKFIQTIKIFRDLCGFLLNRKYSMLPRNLPTLTFSQQSYKILTQISFFASCCTYKNRCTCIWKRYLFLCWFLLISVLKLYGVDIFKIYGEELKIAVHFMDVEVKWDKAFLN